jgi:hypothetical protein
MYFEWFPKASCSDHSKPARFRALHRYKPGLATGLMNSVGFWDQWSHYDEPFIIWIHIALVFFMIYIYYNIYILHRYLYDDHYHLNLVISFNYHIAFWKPLHAENPPVDHIPKTGFSMGFPHVSPRMVRKSRLATSY